MFLAWCRLVSGGLIEMDSWKVKAVDKKAFRCEVDPILAELLDMTATKKFLIILWRTPPAAANNFSLRYISLTAETFNTLRLTDANVNVTYLV